MGGMREQVDAGALLSYGPSFVREFDRAGSYIDKILKGELEDRRKLGDPEAKKRPTGRHHRQFPSLLEQMQALAEQLELANERAERAERESEYFAEMMQAVAKHAKLDDDAVAEIRAKVRAAHDAETEPE
jgi:hypothetical protein